MNGASPEKKKEKERKGVSPVEGAVCASAQGHTMGGSLVTACVFVFVVQRIELEGRVEGGVAKDECGEKVLGQIMEFVCAREFKFYLKSLGEGG